MLIEVHQYYINDLKSKLEKSKNNVSNETTNDSALHVNGDSSTDAWNGILNTNGNPLYIGTNNI